MIKMFQHKRRVFKFAFTFALVNSMYLFFDPHLDTGIKIPHFDKLGHFIAFGGLSFLFDMAFGLAKIWGIVAALIYGISVELIQGTLPNRQASIADVIADMAGCFVYYFAFRQIVSNWVERLWTNKDV